MVIKHYAKLLLCSFNKAFFKYKMHQECCITLSFWSNEIKYAQRELSAFMYLHSAFQALYVKM